MVRFVMLWILLVACLADSGSAQQASADANAREDDFYKLIPISLASGSDSRSATWQPAPDGVPLEVSGIAMLSPSKLAVTIRKGEIWLLNGVDRVGQRQPKDLQQSAEQTVKYHRFATALHEPLGLLFKDDAFYTVQRSELTRVRDRDGDQIADEYRAVAKGWGVTGHYHEYAYGPKQDRQGNLWLTLNIGLGLKGKQLERTVQNQQLGYRQGLWRGWSLKVDPDGKTTPVSAGMRSPSGLGMGPGGEMFYTDQQGNWVATNSLNHLRMGVFHHHPESLASAKHQDSPLAKIDAIPNGVPFPSALRSLPQMVPPAVWFPYKKMGQSATDVMLDQSSGAFGPFAGQLFVGEFTQAAVHRVFLEKVNGVYQGACFPFRSGFASAVLRLAQSPDGSVYAGLTNRGWSSLGSASYGLQRLVWTGRTPFEIKEMRAKPDGFELAFTKPVDVTSAQDPSSYRMSSHTYRYHSSYGSDEIMRRELAISNASVSSDRMSVRLKVQGLRKHFVHELHVDGVRGIDGETVLHPHAYYTLNELPADD